MALLAMQVIGPFYDPTTEYEQLATTYMQKDEYWECEQIQ